MDLLFFHSHREMLLPYPGFQDSHPLFYLLLQDVQKDSIHLAPHGICLAGQPGNRGGSGNELYFWFRKLILSDWVEYRFARGIFHCKVPA